MEKAAVPELKSIFVRFNQSIRDSREVLFFYTTLV